MPKSGKKTGEIVKFSVSESVLHRLKGYTSNMLNKISAKRGMRRRKGTIPNAPKISAKRGKKRREAEREREGGREDLTDVKGRNESRGLGGHR